MATNGTSSPEEIIELLAISTPEVVFIAIEALVHVINLIILAYASCHRNYLPINVTQVPLVALGLFSAILWWLGALASLRILPQANNPVFLQCSLWGIWVYDVFGLFVFFCTLLLRFIRLLAFTRYRWNLKGWRIWAVFITIWSPIWIYAVVASALQVNGPIIDGNGFQVCFFQDPALYVLMGIVIVYLLGLFVGMVALRKTKDRFVSEYKKTLWGSVYAIVCCVVYSVILFLGFHNQVWGRIFNSVLVTSISIAYLCVTIAYPAFKCLTDRAAYEAVFKNKIKGYGPKLSISQQPSQDLGSSPSSPHTLEMDVLE